MQVPHSYTTARTLLSLLRLAQALARLRFQSIVTQVHEWRVSSAPAAACLLGRECPVAAIVADSEQ